MADPLPTQSETADRPSPPKRKYSRSAAIYPRKRATQACHTCRFRRTKCDNARPSCDSCVRLGAECTYQENDPSTFDPASLAILKRLDDLEVLIQTKTNDPSPLSLVEFPSTSPSDPRGDLSSSATDRRIPRKLPFITIETVLEWPVFDDCNFSRHFHLLDAFEENTHDRAAPISIDFDLYKTDSLLREFFDNVHIFNPTLEEEEVREYVNIVRLNGIGWDAMSCLLLLIYAHGSIATPFVKYGQGVSPASFGQSKYFLQAEAYFCAARKRMGPLLCSSGVIEAQCFFLAGVYLMTTLRPVAAWRMFVQALACCQGFSLRQRNNPRGQNESSTKQRIYWTCFKSELELRLELNVSQTGVLDLSYPVLFPSPPERLKSKDEATWYFYLAEIALRRLKNRILDSLYRHDAASPEFTIEHAIFDFEEQTDAWLASLPEALALGVVNPDTEQYEPFRFILSGHFLDCQETMYWHFVVEGIYGRVCSGNEHFIRKGLKVCVDRIQQNKTGFYHRHHGTWLMLRSCTRSALVLLAAGRCVELAGFLSLGWKEAVLDVTRMLAFWKDESGDILEMLNVLQTLLDVDDSAM